MSEPTKKNGWVGAIVLGVLTLVLIPIGVNLISHYLTREPPSGAPGGAPRVDVSSIEAEPPFETFLRASPILMEVAGVKVIRLKDGRRVVLSVASTELKDDSAGERLRAERVCRLKAATGLLKENQGILIAHAESLRTSSVAEGSASAALPDVLELTTAKVEGVVKEMPPVGRWKSANGKVFFLATGVVLDKDGTPAALD